MSSPVNTGNSELLLFIIDMLNGLDTYGMQECEDIICFLKACSKCQDSFGHTTREALNRLLTETDISCPIALSKRSVEQININCDNYEDEPQQFHELVWLLQILLEP
jgi:hypothetical protein